jgi:capsular exopolysaccharide synthesis family protein
MIKDNNSRKDVLNLEKHWDNSIDLRKVLATMASNWYFFLFGITICLLMAFFYNSVLIPTYRVSATLLINEETKDNLIGEDQRLSGIRIGESNQNLDNQIMILSSKTLIERTLRELVNEIEYYQKGLFNKLVLYPEHPITVIPEITDSFPRRTEFKVRILDDNTFILSTRPKGDLEFKTKLSFGENIRLPDGSFSIEKTSGNLTYKSKKRIIYFQCRNYDDIAEDYAKRIKVIAASKSGTVLRISMDGTNKSLDVDFINKLLQNFVNYTLDKKNLEAIKTIAFIDDQLIGISDSLFITENKLQDFRAKNRVMNLSSQGQVIIDQAMRLENEKARIEIEANYYNYLADYLLKDNADEVPIAPATMGISDPGLTNLVKDLTELQGQLYSKSLGKKNPLQAQLSLRISNTKEALKETLNGVMRANKLAQEEILSQIHTVNAQAAALPVTERQLLGIERKFKLNDELYTFLLEKRAVAQIQKASNLPDNEIIDSARADATPIKPKKVLIYLLAVFAGIVIPFFSILGSSVFNNKIRQPEDILRVTDIPIIGYIPHSLSKNGLHVFSDLNSPVAEAFRALRSRMKFMIQETKAPVILITSPNKEEGKTFTATNLASVFSMSGKKTIVIDYDLRNPSIHKDFNLNNIVGLSSWLAGSMELQEIIYETGHENLAVIPAGPRPANPAELICMDKTEILLRMLKEQYDFIIIDSSPIGKVPDALHLASLADSTIIVQRFNFSLQEMLKITIDDLKYSNISNICLTLNDLESEYNKYGY